MICISIGEPSVALCRILLDSLDPGRAMAEIRLDGADLTEEEVREIFGLYPNLIATFRPTNTRTDEERWSLLKAAIDAGAAWVDVDIENQEDFRHEISGAAKQKQCRLILSYHNYQNTPGLEQLETIMDRCFQAGAGVSKIACTVQNEADAARILSLYARPLPPGVDASGKPFALMALGMGDKGTITRIAATYLGAPFTYASIPNAPQTARGQLDYTTMEQINLLMNRSRDLREADRE